MRIAASRLGAALQASVAAGPIFVLSLAFAEAFSTIPRPIPFEPWPAIGGFVFLLVPSCIVGFIISLLPNIFGTCLLSAAGEASATAREPVVWMGVGGMLGFGIALVFGIFEFSLEATLALVSTSAACAGICRKQMSWEA